MDTRQLHTRGKGWAYTGAMIGGGISIAANVAHSFVPPTGAADTWQPQPGAVIGSMFWPILLFVAVEILARVTWPQGFWWGFLRFGGLLPVAAVAALVSYRHLSALLLFYGEDATVSILGPLAVDGLMVMATAALLVTSKKPIPVIEAGDTASAPADTHRHDTLNAATQSEPTPAHRQTASEHAEPWVPPHLLNIARYASENHAHSSGRRIRADELADRMNITTTVAAQLLDQITAEQHTNQLPVLNGTVLGGDRR